MQCGSIATGGGYLVLYVWLFVLVPLLSRGADAAPMTLKHRVVKTGSSSIATALHSQKRQLPLSSLVATTMYAIQFRVPLDASMIARLKSILGYEPREYVPHDALVVYLATQPIVDAFVGQMTDSVRYVERILNSDRQADHSIVLDKIQIGRAHV